MSQRFMQFDILRAIAITFVVPTHMHLFYDTQLFNRYIFLKIGDPKEK